MRKLKRYGPPILLISPSLFLIGLFVYVLIFSSAQTSMTDIYTNPQFAGTRPHTFVWFTNFIDLLKDGDFQHSLKNLLLYTLVFITGAMFFGFLWAWLLDKRARFEGVFRSVFLFPMAVSSVAAGVVWRWLLNSNVGDRATGLNRLFQMVGLDFLENKWTNNISFGIVAVAIPAIWQMSGYIMALFLAGFRGIPTELREAARVDGANEFKLYRYVIFPQLSPVALSALIILGHMSLKVFDLIMAITGAKFYPTKVPAVDMYNLMTEGNFANAAAVGIILLLVVLVLIVPYLIHTARGDKR
ncbi:MAG: sugar ABC transporter permease [Bifidobacteriaceae bacterium]|jgi:glucose/mannose transport system permease protein|nr:sugar ABC transporter permease [Bifidobacteriaceae bacterium]